MDGVSFWRELFGNDAPVEIEIGSGDGTFLLRAAEIHPETNFLGIERSPSKARRLAARLAACDLPNVRSLYADAACVVGSLVPNASVGALHVYFPDPWPKRRHTRRRVLTATLIAACARTLAGGGRLFLASDVYGYLRLMRAQILADGHFDEHEMLTDLPGPETGFARKYRAAGRGVYAAAFVRRTSKS